MEENTIKMSTHSKVIFCLHNFCIPLLIYVFIIANFFEGSGPQPILIVIFIVLFAVSMINLFVKLSDYNKYIFFSNNKFMIVKGKKSGLKVIKEVMVNDVREIEQGKFGIIYIKTNKEDIQLNYTASLSWFLTVPVLCMPFVLKGKMLSNNIIYQIKSMLNPDNSIIYKSRQKNEVIVNIFCWLILLFYMYFAALAIFLGALAIMHGILYVLLMIFKYLANGIVD